MSDFDWLPKNSELAKLVQSYDWSKTSLGTVDQWPPCLKTTISLIMGSRFPMFIWFGPDKINIYNDSYASIAGPSKHPKYFGCPAREMWAEIWETIEPFANKVISSGESISFENLPLPVFREGKDNEAYFTFSYSPILDLAGSIQGLLGVVQETTEQVITRREIELEKNKLTDLFMNSPVAFDRFRGPTHVCDLINKVYAEMFGNRDVLGISVRESLPELADQGFFNLLDETYRTGKRYVSPEAAKLIINQNGVQETRFVNFIYEPEKNVSGEVTGIIAMALDITTIVKSRLEDEVSSKKLLSALKDRDASLRKLSLINRVGQQLSSILDMKKLVQAVTDAGVEITGAQFGAFFYNSLDEAGKELLLYTVSGVPAEEFSKFPNPRATAVFHPTFVGAGTVLSDDITKDPRYGQNSPFKGIPQGHLPVRSYLAVSVISRSGEVIGGLFFGHAEAGVFSKASAEIIEGLASQAAIAMDNARLYQNIQQSLSARDQFISVASHELKTPLTTLSLQSQMRNRLLRDSEVPGLDKTRLLKMIKSDELQLKRLTRLIDDMLDISRIQTGKLSHTKVDFDLAVTLREIIDRFQTQFSEAEIPLELTSSVPSMISADSFRIEQVIINLLNNAFKYGNKTPVTVELQNNQREAILRVIDKGMGIKAEDQKRIFSRFERAVPEYEVSGLGIGLSISKEIIDAHGGSISVRSEVGKGSVFEVRIPLAEAAPEITQSPSVS